MKRVACLLASFLVLFWASSGMVAAQSLSELAGPLDELSDPLDKIKEPVDKIKVPVDKVKVPLPDPVKKPVEDVTKEVEKVVDKVAKEVTEAAKNPGGSAGSVADKPKPAPAPAGATPPSRSKPANPKSGSSSADDKIASATNRSGKASSRSGKASSRSGKASKRGGAGNPERDTEEVAAAGHTIEPAQVKGTQIIAPATEVDEPEGSGLSRTGVQILAWLILACWLLGTGTAFVWRGRTRVRAARS